LKIDNFFNVANLIPGYQCPADDVAAGCLGPKNCLHPNPYDCHSLIQCTAEGLAFVIPCVSVNLVYDDSQNHCDLLSNTKLCNEKIEEETDAPTNVGPTDPTTVTTSDAPTDAQTDGPTDAPNKWTN
jgi:hypothetical protein